MGTGPMEPTRAMRREAGLDARRVAVFGLGYVGLPLIRACVNAGHQVIGFDVNRGVVDGLRNGRSHVDDVADQEIQDWTTRSFLPTTDTKDLSGIDVFVICVPTPLTDAGGPDLTMVKAASATVSRALGAASASPLVVLESTTYPGTTEEVVLPILEESGLLAGKDFALAFSPERIDPGNKSWTFENTPKIVGGLTPDCAAAAEAFYAPLATKVVTVKGLKEAEMAKLLENTYRHVNIALVNELARLCHVMGIDIWDVIAAAETKPYGFQAFRPGPGVGGHCIPIDPNYLGHRVRVETGRAFRFVELAQDINSSMPEYVVQRVAEMLNAEGIALRGSQVLLLGLSYKADVADARETPATRIIEQLEHRGAVVSVHDPSVASLVVGGKTHAIVEDLHTALEEATCVVLLQAHSSYMSMGKEIASTFLLDTRGTQWLPPSTTRL
jgi:UDP-N-acetyl-D-glucosamine dehydrogenase